MSQVIHHPDCINQDESQDHGPQGLCGTWVDEEEGVEPVWREFSGWPKVVQPEQPPQATEEAPVPPSHPEAVLAQPTADEGVGGQAQAVAAATAGNGHSPTSAHEWKTDAKTTELRVPSGHICLAKKPGGMAMFLQKGAIPNALIPIIKKHMNDARDVDMAKMGEEMLDDPSKINDILELCDNVCVYTVVQPKLVPTPRFTNDDPRPVGYNVGDVMPEECRDPNTLYVDEVDIEDKMFIFQWAVGGTRDVAQFRREQASALADLPTVEELGTEA